MSFSANLRRDNIEKLASQEFDLLVIGGGITGAGIALDAASRGLSTALVEKNDFASGTSSRSTKLIHGGLRYLKQFEVKLVREVGLERAIVYNNAPHIVIPEKMLLPIVKGGSLGKYSSSLGLYVYDRLARVRRKERRRMLSKAETMGKEPLLRSDDLLGGGEYIEYRSDDARLVMEVMKTAAGRGAVCMNYMTFRDFIHKDGRVAGGKVTDRFTGGEYTIRAKTVINACGPWVDDLRKKEGSLRGKYLMQTKGIHIVVPRERLPVRSSVYFDVPTDDRMIFAIPRGRIVYIGTTDTVFKGDMDHPYTSREDAQYVLDAANDRFPSARLTLDDIESSWAGLRPLIHEKGRDPSEVSRKDEIFLSETRLISIAGGKLTGYRKMAERSVDEAMAQLVELDGRKFVKCRTKRIVLTGGNLDGHTGVKKYMEYLSVQYPRVSPEEIRELVYKYGDNTDEILKAHVAKDNSRALVFSELDYCIGHENTTCIGDFLIRRTGMLFFDRPAIVDRYLELHDYMCAQLGHDKDLADRMLRDFEQEFYGVVAFKGRKAALVSES
jgi:glycerol-3-phosphate dehydrogenase